MTIQNLTSASRFLSEIKNFQEKAKKDLPIWKNLENIYSDSNGKWQYGVSALHNLIDLTILNTNILSEESKNKTVNSINSLKSFSNPQFYHVSFKDIEIQHFTEANLARLEGLHEVLVASNNFYKFEQERANQVSLELSDLISYINNSDKTEIDDFLIKQLENITFVLDNYILYGPNGVKHHIEIIMGNFAFNKICNISIPKNTLDNFKKILSWSKKAIDLLVYANSMSDAITWLNDLDINILPPFE